LSRKNKIAIAAITAVALILIIAVPFVSAQAPPSDITANSKIFKAQGWAFQKIDSDTIKYYHANFALSIQAASTNGTVKKFDVTGGTVIVNGISYSISNGNGAVLTGRRIILLQASGTSTDGQPITLKLEGRYFWMWGHLYFTRIGARLLTGNGNYTMLMRAAV